MLFPHRRQWRVLISRLVVLGISYPRSSSSYDSLPPLSIFDWISFNFSFLGRFSEAYDVANKCMRSRHSIRLPLYISRRRPVESPSRYSPCAFAQAHKQGLQSPTRRTSCIPSHILHRPASFIYMRPPCALSPRPYERLDAVGTKTLRCHFPDFARRNATPVYITACAFRLAHLTCENISSTRFGCAPCVEGK